MFRGGYQIRTFYREDEVPGVYEVVLPDMFLRERFVEVVRSEVDIGDFSRRVRLGKQFRAEVEAVVLSADIPGFWLLSTSFLYVVQPCSGGSVRLRWILVVKYIYI